MLRLIWISFFLVFVILFVFDWLSPYVLFSRWLSINKKERW